MHDHKKIWIILYFFIILPRSTQVTLSYTQRIFGPRHRADNQFVPIIRNFIN